MYKIKKKCISRIILPVGFIINFRRFQHFHTYYIFTKKKLKTRLSRGGGDHHARSNHHSPLP